MHSQSTVNVQVRPPVDADTTSDRNNSHIPEHENSWRSKFPKISVLILSIIQMLFTVIIFILEIASLAIYTGYRPTGVGIWCAVSFIPASVLTFLLVFKKDGSRVWATRVFIAQLILLVFTFILIGITGDDVSTFGNSDYTVLDRKYRVIQAELAFGILLMFSGLVYIGIYIVVTIMALWRPFHTIDAAHLFRR